MFGLKIELSMKEIHNIYNSLWEAQLSEALQKNVNR